MLIARSGHSQKEAIMTFRAHLAALALTLAAAPALAEDFPGDPVAGEAYARSACSECHEVTRWQDWGNMMGPSFFDVAAEKSTTGMSLLAWLTSINHPTMPDLIVPPEQARDVTAYILSLRPE